MEECCKLINDEWPRSETARMMMLQASCDTLPTSLILIRDRTLVLGHCKLTRIPNIPESCFLETVVISKKFRGQKLGSFLMTKVEEYCKNELKLTMVHLSTKGQENFYSKLGYSVCAPVSIYGYSQQPLQSINKNYSNENIVAKPVPKENTSVSVNIPPPPPPPPINNGIIPISTLKSSKTYMSKVL